MYVPYQGPGKKRLSPQRRERERERERQKGLKRGTFLLLLFMYLRTRLYSVGVHCTTVYAVLVHTCCLRRHTECGILLIAYRVWCTRARGGREESMPLWSNFFTYILVLVQPLPSHPRTSMLYVIPYSYHPPAFCYVDGKENYAQKCHWQRQQKLRAELPII